MEKRYYIDGKCVLSYDDDVFSTDDDYTNIKELVTVQNPLRFVVSCCAKQRIEKSFSALTCYYFVDKNDDFLSVYQTCG